MSCLRQSECVTNAAAMRSACYRIEYNRRMLLKAEFPSSSATLRAPIERVIEAAGRIILGKESQVRLPPPPPPPPRPPPPPKPPPPGQDPPPPPPPHPPAAPLPPLPLSHHTPPPAPP